MSQTDRYTDRVIALSALVQATTLVQQIAETGISNSSEVKTMLSSLLVQDAPNTTAVYGDLSALNTGIRELNKQLSKKKEDKDVELLRYMITLLHLERRLAKHPEMLDLITKELDDLPKQIDYFGDIMAPQVIARLADIYQRTISQLKPRVHVFGDQHYLEQPNNVNKIRALLLSGIRAAVLWRQKGGRRWQIILQPGKILDTASKLIL